MKNSKYDKTEISKIWQNLKLKMGQNSKCDNLKTQYVTELKNSNRDKAQNSKCDKIQRLKMWQNSKCDRTRKLKKVTILKNEKKVAKLKQNWKCDKLKLKMWQN